MANKDFSKPTKVDRATIIFPANVTNLMPDQGDIPDEFKRHDGTPWNRWVSQWFFDGLKDDQIPQVKDGLDAATVWGHLRTVLGSFEPKHEHKEAAVAYLASLWFKEVPKGTAK